VTRQHARCNNENSLVHTETHIKMSEALMRFTFSAIFRIFLKVFEKICEVRYEFTYRGVYIDAM